MFGSGHALPASKAEEGAQQPLRASRAGGELDLMRKSIVKLERLILHMQQLKTDASSLIAALMLQPLPSVGFFHPAVWPLATFILMGVFESL